MKRIDRISTLIDDRYGGSQAAFARAISKSPAQVHQWLTGNRSVGDGMARHIEMTLGLGEGWMDGANRSAGTELLEIYDSLDDQFKKILLEQARAIRKNTTN